MGQGVNLSFPFLTSFPIYSLGRGRKKEGSRSISPEAQNISTVWILTHYILYVVGANPHNVLEIGLLRVKHICIKAAPRM